MEHKYIDSEELLHQMRLNTVIMHEHTQPHHADNGVFLNKIIELCQNAPEVIGTWEEIEYTNIKSGEVISTASIRCTNCKRSDIRWYKEMKYCPNCGAKMKEK